MKWLCIAMYRGASTRRTPIRVRELKSKTDAGNRVVPGRIPHGMRELKPLDADAWMTGISRTTYEVRELK